MILKKPDQAKQLVRQLILVIILASLFGCNLPSADVTAPTATAISARQTLFALTYPSPTPSFQSVVATPTPWISQQPLVTLPATLPPSTPTPVLAVPAGIVVYYAQSGDTLKSVAARFRVSTGEINSPEAIPAPESLLPIGLALFIPTPTFIAPYQLPALPDSEIVFGPGSGRVDVNAIVQQANGYLARYQESLWDRRYTGAEIVDLVARETSTNPRLLLALIEYRSGWLFGQPLGEDGELYPIGFKAEKVTGLYAELFIVARLLAEGYYGWSDGSLKVLTFKDGSIAEIAPALNPGSVALQNLFASLYEQKDFHHALYGPGGFLALEQQLFGDPFARAALVGPLLTPAVSPPTLTLPFLPGLRWALTSGPHLTWQPGTPRGSLDFAPRVEGQRGCMTSSAWATSPVRGLVTRSARGAVAIDLDGDGDESTGWVIIFMHMASQERVRVGAWVKVDDPSGHPSCDGGYATGLHLHITRKYNGVWIGAEGPLPLILDGWQAFASPSAYAGYLVRDGVTVYSNTADKEYSHIYRDN